ncbi:MAG: hypothetical protein ACTS5I_12755 [Rhodanobacter sp.]
MGRKPLNTNPYLRDPVQRERSVFKSVASSSAIEGIRAPFRESAIGNVLSRKSRKSGKPRTRISLCYIRATKSG